MERNWTTRDGRVVAIKDMSDSHLINTINMLKRKGFITPEAHKWYFSHFPSPSNMGEMAYDAAEEECLRGMDAPVSEELAWLEEEAKKRNIKV